jgi:hypothetical protein
VAVLLLEQQWLYLLEPTRLLLVQVALETLVLTKV